MISKKTIFLECVILIGIFIISGFVSAFGAGIPYGADNPLKLNPGESKDFSVRLQSPLNEGNMTILAVVEQGSEIAKIIDSPNTYEVIADRSVGAIVNVRVSVPENAKVGTEYDIKIRYRNISPSEGGTVGISLSIANDFKVIVVSKSGEIPEKKLKERMSKTLIILLIVAILVVIAIIWFLVKRKK